jgi:serine phosphatase RsbU (regulator of sigma subunit)
MSPDESVAEETIVRNAKYQITRRKEDEFHLIRITGRYGDEMLDDLRTKVFLYKTNYGVDTSRLVGVTPLFAREIADTALAFSAGERRLVLISPPDTLRSLLNSRTGKNPVEVVLSEDKLRKPKVAGEDPSANAFKELERIRKEFQTNRHWQFIDREGYWICPFCGQLQAEVRLTSPLSIPGTVIEKAYKHLWSRCSSFKPSSHVLKPLNALQETLRRTNEDKMVVTKTKLDKMENELAALKGKATEMEDSVKRASERQRRLLPTKAPEVAGAEIDLVYRPADVVSGDFYDFVPLDDDKIAFLIGDVSGHGIEAGILMGMAKKVLSIRLQDFSDPKEAVVRANEDIDRDLGRVNFVTAFVAIYDPKLRVLRCIRAGHNPPLLFNPARQERCVQLKPGGLGLGIMSESSFEPTIQPMDVEIMPGDVLLLYTDGLAEARDEEGEQFGTDRMTQILGSSYGLSSALILSNLAHALDDFAGHRVSEDDITAVCVRFL